MDDQSGPLVRQHIRLAVKGGDPQESGSFGCESPFKPAGSAPTPRGTMKEGSRGISRPRGYHPEPDHGGY
jgi:hypothetical protein